MIDRLLDVLLSLIVMIDLHHVVRPHLAEMTDHHLDEHLYLKTIDHHPAGHLYQGTIDPHHLDDGGIPIVLLDHHQDVGGKVVRLQGSVRRDMGDWLRDECRDSTSSLSETSNGRHKKICGSGSHSQMSMLAQCISALCYLCH